MTPGPGSSAENCLTAGQGAVKPPHMNSPRFRALLSRPRYAAAAALLVSSVTAFAWAEVKVAVVDTQRAMMETEDGLRMQANIKKVFDTKQQELETKQNELEQERADIEKQQAVISQEALQRRAEAWQREMVALQQMSVAYNQELQKKQSELTQPIIEKTMLIIRRIATSQGYDLVVDKAAVPYSRSDLDLTDRVITMYNGGTLPAEGDAKPAAEKPAADKKPAAPATKKPAEK